MSARRTHRRAPRRAGPAVEALTGRLAPVTPLGAVQRAWPAVVGPLVAAEAEPVSERGGVVEVRCRSSVWAQELTFMAPDLTRRLNAALGQPAVRELRCRAGR